MPLIIESTITEAWTHVLEEGGPSLTCFKVADTDQHAFWGGADWLPLLKEAIALGTRVRVMASEPEIMSCGAEFCGDGCCDDPNCTNVPEEEPASTFLLKADTIEWLP